MDELRAMLTAMLEPLDQFGDRKLMAVMPQMEVASILGDLGEHVKEARAFLATVDESPLTPRERESLRTLAEVLASMDLLSDRVMQAPSVDDGVRWSWPMPGYLRRVRRFLAATEPSRGGAPLQ